MKNVTNCKSCMAYVTFAWQFKGSLFRSTYREPSCQPWHVYNAKLSITGRGTYSTIKLEAERVQSNDHSGETALPTSLVVLDTRREDRHSTALRWTTNITPKFSPK